MSDEHDDRLAKDLYKSGELRPPVAVGARTVDRVLGRQLRRPAGNSRRMWMRVAGEDPYETFVPVREDVTRKTVYADGRFVRLEDGKVPKRGSGPRKVAPPKRDAIPSGFRDIPTAKSSGPSGQDLIPPGFRNIPTAPSSSSSDKPKNLGDSLIPPGFRDIPTAKSQREAPKSNPSPQKENVGESLIPPGFRDIPFAKPEPRRPPPKPDTQPAPPPLPTRQKKSQSGRVRQARSRTVIRQPKATPPPPAAEAPKPAPEPPKPPPVVEPPKPPGPAPSAGGLDDLFAAPAEGRKRIGRRRRPAPTVTETKTSED
jgi:hypothetical protein